MKKTLLYALLLLPAPALAGKPAAVERTEKFVELLLKVKPDDGKLTPAQKEANQKLFTELDLFFDYDRLTGDSIAPRAEKFSPAEKAEFQKKFRELIRLIAYPDSGAFFKKTRYTIGAVKEQGEAITVPIDAKVVKDDLETKLELHWKKSPEGLKLMDVSFDGDSLVKDYTNQFARIIDKEGAKGLIAKVEKRRAELDAKAAK